MKIENTGNKCKNTRLVNYDRLYLTMAILLFPCLAVSVYTFTLLDKALIYWTDTPTHIIAARVVLEKLSGGNPAAAFLEPFYLSYPPLVYFVSMPFFAFFDFSLTSAVMSQWPFWLALIMGTFYMGKHLGNSETGFLAALMMISTPFLFKAANEYCLDVPLTAMTVIAVLCLLKSDGLKYPGWTIGFFITCGLGVMTKTLFPVYVIGPFIVALVFFFKLLRKSGTPHREYLYFLIIPATFGIGFVSAHLLKNPAGAWLQEMTAVNSLVFILSVTPFIIAYALVHFRPSKSEQINSFVKGTLLFFMICWIVYGMHYHVLIEAAIRKQAGGGNTNNPAEFLRLVVFGSMGLKAVFFSIIGLGFVFFDKRKVPGAALQVWGYGVSIALLYAMPIKDIRYFLPVLAFAVPLGVFWIARIRAIALKATAVTLIIYLSIVGWLGWSLKGTLFTMPVQSTILAQADRFNALTVYPPRKKGAGAKAVARCIKTLTANQPHVLMTVGHNKQIALTLKNGLYIHYATGMGQGLRIIHRIGNFSALENQRIPMSKKKGGAYYVTILHRGQRGRKLKDYRYLMVVYTHSGSMEEYVPLPARMVFQGAGVNYRPDVRVNTGPGPGYRRRDANVVIMRIPLPFKGDNPRI